MLGSPFGIVHFATHAEVDLAEPARTAILLGAAEPEHDGRLSIAEISALGLREPLVVLSACRSAGGEVLQGEGVLGLTRAFFEGGAGTVIGNLWPVEDRAASRLVDRFYRHLVSGLSVTDALGRAQRDGWAAGDPTAAWASLVVLGNGDRRLTFPRARPRPWLLVIPAILVGTAALLIVTRFARRRAP
jgi:CHAT domain-containing protein